MTTDTPSPRGVTAREFFGRRIKGASMHEAHLATRLSYSTVHRASRGEAIALETAKALEEWSRGLTLDLFISAAETLGLNGEASTVADDPATADALPPPAAGVA